MTLRLAVDSAAWKRHVRHVADEVGEILPVVKGNGYGFGRAALMSHAAQLAPHVAVGSVYELADVPSSLTPFVLTPMGMAVDSLPRADAVLTVTNHHNTPSSSRFAQQCNVSVSRLLRQRRYGVPQRMPGTVWSVGRCTHHSSALMTIMPMKSLCSPRLCQVICRFSPVISALRLLACVHDFNTAWWYALARRCGSVTNRRSRCKLTCWPCVH
jgi:hypothetical protein